MLSANILVLFTFLKDHLLLYVTCLCLGGIVGYLLGYYFRK